MRIGQATKSTAKICNKESIVKGRKGWFEELEVFQIKDRGLGWGLILKNSCSGGIIEGAKTSEVWSSSHEEGGIRVVRFGLEKDNFGLPWGYEKGVRVKRLNINAIGIDDTKGMVGDAKEEVIVECSIDQTEEVCFPSLHL